MAINRLTQSSVQSGLPKFDSVWDGYSNPSSMDSLASVTLQTAAANITFSNIPQTYTNLYIRGFARSDRSGSGGDYIIINFNGDTGTNYSEATLYGNGTAAGAAAGGSISGIELSRVPTSSHTANLFGVCIIDILDYTSTNRNKTVRCVGGYDNNGSGSEVGYISLTSGARYNTGAITSIVLKPNVGSNFTASSYFSLYGVK